MTQIEYHLTFPKTDIQFEESTVTLRIGNVRSRLPSVLYFIFRGYDSHDNLIYTYTSPRWVIDVEYSSRTRTWDIDDAMVEAMASTQIELVAVGISSENPLYFNNVIFNNDYDIGYHEPNERVSKTIGFKNTRYCNLYGTDGNFLQVIRPNGETMRTDVISKCGCSVIAPHLSDESNIDDPVNVFYEFINQTEQRIDVLR